MQGGGDGIEQFAGLDVVRGSSGNWRARRRPRAAFTPVAPSACRTTNQHNLSRGARMRTLYLDSISNDGSTDLRRVLTTPYQDRTGRVVSLSEITDDNWRDVADVAPTDDQRRFVAALGARYLLLSMRGDLWNSLAVLAGDTVAGHVMWAFDTDDGTHWIGGMVVDAAQQGKGVGRAAMLAAVDYLSALPGAREIRLAYHPDNVAAAALYASIGFKDFGDREDEDIVVALPVSASLTA
jgi:diamine N-acetyltransferase